MGFFSSCRNKQRNEDNDVIDGNRTTYYVYYGCWIRKRKSYRLFNRDWNAKYGSLADYGPINSVNKRGWQSTSMLTMRLLRKSVKRKRESFTLEILNSQITRLRQHEIDELMWLAFDYGKLKILNKLVRAGADLSVRKVKRNRTVLHAIAVSPRYDSVAKRELVRLMLDFGADINARDSMGYSVLHYAIDNCWELVELLLERGAELTVVSNGYYDDLRCAFYEKPETFILLIEHLTDEETKKQRSAKAISDLVMKNHWWYYHEREEKAGRFIKKLLDHDALVDRVDPTAEQRAIASLMEMAFLNKNKYAIKALLEYGADPHQKDECGQTALYNGTTFESSCVARWLIGSGARIDARNDDGGYPIHGACNNDSVEIINLLLNLGADVSVTDNRGFTPFQTLMSRETRGFASRRRVAKHFALIVTRGETINGHDMEFLRENDSNYEYYKKCCRELEKMRTKDFSYLSPLLSTDNIRTRILIMRNAEFVEKFKRDRSKLTDLFPEYGDMLVNFFDITEMQWEILSAEIAHLQKACEGDNLPYIVTESIAYYSCLKKMKRYHRDYFLTIEESLHR